MTTNMYVLRRLKNDCNISYEKDLNEVILKNNIIIGRDYSECNLHIKCIEISRKHALIRYKDNRWSISDLESTNGVFINGEQLIPFTPHYLVNGDEISFAPTSISRYNFRFEAKPVVKRSISQTNDSEESNERRDSGEKRFRKKEDEKQIIELLDSELTCIVCQELFVRAVNLNCSHTFCLYCIEQWKQQHNDCPICRQQIMNQNRALIFDNLIDNMVLKMTSEERQRREELIEEREKVETSQDSQDSEDSSDNCSEDFSQSSASTQY